MMMSSVLSTRICRCAVVLVCAGLVAGGTARAQTAQAQDVDAKIAAAADTPDAVKHGELVFHGNYCGVGNRAGAEPIDALDVACMHHDACTPTGKVQSCDCNARLVEETGAIIRDPSQPAELKALASLTGTAAAAGMVLCAPSALVRPAAVAKPAAVAAPPEVATTAAVAAPTSIAPPATVEPVATVTPVSPEASAPVTRIAPVQLVPVVPSGSTEPLP